MKTRYRKNRVPAIAFEGEKALQAAVAEVVEEHKRTGSPLAVWQNGSAVMMPADKAVAAVRETRWEYSTKSRR
jgi:fumarate hydratase class II